MVPDADPALRVAMCRDADVPALMRFIGTQWRAGHLLSRDEALLRWQFTPDVLRAGPTRGGPTVLLAWSHGEIVGMLGLTGFDLTVVGQRFAALWLSHWFAAPAHRSSNAALRLIWAAREVGVDALATLGANASSAKLLARLGLQVIPSVSRWVGVFDVAATVDLVQAANPEVPLDHVTRLCRSHVVGPSGFRAPPGRFRSVGWSVAAAEAWDRFWVETVAPRLVGATRDAGYLRWRYVDHPRFTYQLRFAQRDADGAVAGLAVFRIEQVRDRATRVLRIVDFLASEEGEGCLVAAVLDAARESGAAFGDFYWSSARAAGPLARAGLRLQAADGAGVAFPSRLQPLTAGHFRMTALVLLPGEWHGRIP